MNRLAHESSPYLLQHKDNPVDWYPWGAAAIERAREENKPIFVSIGYAACHWCHVMEHESFENEQLAAVLNEHFVCIKIDREERPDLDHIYMQAVQTIGGRGGWPLSAFLTPDLQPFYGGTYWPPTARGGMPGFDEVLRAVVDAWTNRREMVLQQAAQVTDHLQQRVISSTGEEELTGEVLQAAHARLSAAFDPHFGGFGQAPKFPHAVDLQLLLRIWHRQRDPHTLNMVRLTLDKMAAGGIYDHLGGGFARYSVDERWLVPHFEKMLYDNALLASAYLDAYLVTEDRNYARVAQETIDYVLRDLGDASGGFHSTEDADSEGEEGKFYVWSVEEILQILGEERGARFCRVYDVTPGGNFEGQNILNRPKTLEQCAAILRHDPQLLEAELAEARAELFAARARRVRPGKDDKILVSWNALMIQALTRAAGQLDRPDYLVAAQRAARFLLTSLCRSDGRLLHSWRQGRAYLDAYLDDYASLIEALVTLYETDFDERWVDEAVRLTEIVLRHFPDSHQGGFFFTADDHESLITRTKEVFDGSVPSSNAMMATALVRLGKLTGRQDLLEAAHRTLKSALPIMRTAPEAVAQMLVAADLWLGPTWEIVLTGDARQPATQQVIQALRRTFLPRRVVACRSDAREDPEKTPHSAALEPLFVGKQFHDQQPLAYVCEGFACRAPVAGTEQILATWEALSSGN
ncbi:MAG: thioredoxin domain-containing protein [Pirellulaceae bacterium]